MAPRGACAAAGDAGCRVHAHRVTRYLHRLCGCIQQRPEPIRLCRRPKRDSRVPLAAAYDQAQARAADLVADLVRRQVAAIVTPGNTPAALAAKAATATIPIIFGIGEDPVRLGLAASLARPGGNTTGINFFAQEVVAKRLRLLHDFVPKAVRVATLVDPANKSVTASTLRQVQEAAPAIGLQIQTLNASTIGEINAAFAVLARDRPDPLFVGGGAFFLERRVQFATLTARYTIPATYSARDYVTAGGLMSYGACRPAGTAINQIRIRHQPSNGARTRH